MKKTISTDKAPAAIGPYSQAIEANGMVYTSGIIPVVPATGEIPEGSAPQARQPGGLRQRSRVLPGSAGSLRRPDLAFFTHSVHPFLAPAVRGGLR